MLKDHQVPITVPSVDAVNTKRPPNSVAVSIKSSQGIAVCLPSSRSASTPAKVRPVHPLQAAPPIRCRTESKTPTTQENILRHTSSSSVSSLKATVHERGTFTSVVSKSPMSGGQHALHIQTAPTLSKSTPACSMWVIPGLPPARVESRWTISFVYKKTRKDLPVLRETVTQQSHVSQPRECSSEHSQSAPEPASRVQEPEPPDKVAVNSTEMDIVSSYNSSPDDPRCSLS
jgi:hypothetical protein